MRSDRGHSQAPGPQPRTPLSASGTRVSGIGVLGIGASGTRASVTGASGTGVSGTRASGTGASGTGVSVTGASGTEVSGTGTLGTGVLGIGASRTGARGHPRPRAHALVILPETLLPVGLFLSHRPGPTPGPPHANKQPLLPLPVSVSGSTQISAPHCVPRTQVFRAPPGGTRDPLPTRWPGLVNVPSVSPCPLAVSDCGAPRG